MTISEEEIHRYHMTERVYGPPHPIINNVYTQVGPSSNHSREGDRIRIVLSISPPSSPVSPPKVRVGVVGGVSVSNGNGDAKSGTALVGGREGNASISRKLKKGETKINESVDDLSAQTGEEMRKVKKSKKHKKGDTGESRDGHASGSPIVDKRKGKEKEPVDGKGKGKGKERAPLTQSDGRADITSSTLEASIATIEGEGTKRKKDKKPEITKEQGELTPKIKKSRKSIPPPLPLPIPMNTTISSDRPGPSNLSHSTPGMIGSDELDSDDMDMDLEMAMDEQDEFEIDQLLPSSPVLSFEFAPLSSNSLVGLHPQPTSTLTPTPTPKPKSRKKNKKRISDSSGFDTPSAPLHLRNPIISPRNVDAEDSTPSRLGMIFGGTPVKKALVRLGASWVTSTPVPK